MQNFIVLGIIPGTNYQTTFAFWLGLSVALLLLPMLRRLWRKRHIISSHTRFRKVAQLLILLQTQA
jgi:hypothetical protein